MVGNNLVGDLVEVAAQGIRVSKFFEISAFDSRDPYIDGVPKGVEPGGVLKVALLNHTEAIAQDLTRVLVAAALNEGIDHGRLSVSQDDIAGGHSVASWHLFRWRLAYDASQSF